jgi:SagB-type dehydrogenase family enzyme
LRAPATKSKRRPAPLVISARLPERVSLDTLGDGKLIVRFDDHSFSLGTFGAAATARAKELRTGLPLASFASSRGNKELDSLLRRLAHHGLLEYRLGTRVGKEILVIEPQTADYWPRTAPLRQTDTLALSRFAYMRRRGSDMVLESPRAGALFTIRDPRIAAAVTALAVPQQVKTLRQRPGFPGDALLALLLDSQLLFKIATEAGAGLRSDEGDDDLVLWDFHDLLFHARSTEGRHANPLGGVYPYIGVIAPTPAVRPSWPGKPIDLRRFSDAPSQQPSPLAALLRRRHSTRNFEAARPITLEELARFLDGAARVLAQSRPAAEFDDGGHAARPYPSAGASYELELYLAVDTCAGLERGFYHYDAGAHALVPIAVAADELAAQFAGAVHATGADAPPHVLITIAARFGRVSWKYRSIAYSLVLKDVGVLMQTLYLMATEMELGGCAIGIVNIERFAKTTGIAFHVEGPVGQFALGRGVGGE